MSWQPERELTYSVSEVDLRDVLSLVCPSDRLIRCESFCYEQTELSLTRCLEIISSSHEDHRIRVRLRLASSGIKGTVMEKRYEGDEKLESKPARKVRGTELVSLLNALYPISAVYAKERLKVVYIDESGRRLSIGVDRIVPRSPASASAVTTHPIIHLEIESADWELCARFEQCPSIKMHLLPRLRPLQQNDSKHLVAGRFLHVKKEFRFSFPSTRQMEDFATCAIRSSFEPANPLLPFSTATAAPAVRVT